MGWFNRPEYGPNVGLIDDVYRQYLDDPTSVSEAWREFFAEHEPEEPEGAPGEQARETPAPAPTPRAGTQEPPPARAAGQEAERAAEPRAAVQDAERAAEPRTDGQATRGDGAAGRDGGEPLRGAAARIVQAMESSLQVPTATSFRVVPARLLEVNRDVLNSHLRRQRGGKVSFTHLIGYAVVKAIQAMPVMNSIYVERDSKPHARHPEHINLGLAVDTRRPDGSRTLLVPNIKAAETLDFAAFVSAYEQLIGKVRANKLTVEDFAGTTVTITNPGTVMSVPRLLAGQAAIIGVGAIDFPAEYRGADPATLAELAVGKTVTLTSTYDHRVIQGAESGEFLAKVQALLLGADGFYDELFRSVGVPYVAVAWRADRRAAPDSLDLAEKQARIYQLINIYRVRGHLIANLAPLGTKSPTMHAELDPASYGLTIWDLERSFLTGGVSEQRELPLREILRILRDAYCRTVGVEYMHISQPDEKAWIQRQVEGPQPALAQEDQLQILHKLIEAEVFERFLHNKYVGQKRFSLEGAESLIPMLDGVLDRAADVKYHLGASGKHTARSGNEIRVEVASNPSHLEAVNPVVEGLVRAKQDLLDRGEEAPVLPVLIHGDAAFAGQGVVAETLNLSQLRGYRTGGTVHVIVNNQLGFTTSPDYGRSSTYASDVAKMIQAPILHVNGDDPEACVRMAGLAFDYRQAFKKDVVIDMWCYRRFGHNEGDEPSFTQPLMYARIKSRPSVRKLYTEALVNRGDFSLEDAERSLEAFRQRLQQAFDDFREDGETPEIELERPAPMATDPKVATAVDRVRLDHVVDRLTTVPEGFAVHPKLTRWLQDRRQALDRNAVDWSLGEALALGSLLDEGRIVRLTGQDTRRGPFSQRHSGLVLLRPHSFEGQGAEHSSARVERFLQLAAEDNIQVAWPSTAAQYFHLLRRQALRASRKPLVVLTPKSLLRLPGTRSTVEELTAGRFQEVLPDPSQPDPEKVRRVLLASGKVFYDLAKRRADADLENLALVRVEQLYPFPAERIRQQLDAYPNAERVLWVQEEPENMGAWGYLAARFERVLGARVEVASRDEAAAPATGSPSIHLRQQQRLLDRALADL